MRNARLDFLRFIGVFLVMCNHLSQTGTTPPERLLGKLCMGGWIGVDIFFVLSGFLVSGLIFKEYDKYDSFHPGHFLIRRGFKIYPTYYIFLLLAFGGAIVFPDILNADPGHPVTLAALWHEALFISNYTTHNNGLLWSICIEEHFYFFLSALFFLLISYRRLNLKYILGTYLILFIGTFISRYNNYLQHSDYEFFRDYTKTHFRVDSLFFGVLLFYIYNYHKPRLDRFLNSRANYAFIAISLIFIATDFILDRHTSRWISVISLGLHPWFFGCLMINFLENKTAIIDKAIKPLAYIGMYSYPIYLFHGRIEAISIYFFKGYPYYIVYFGSSFIVGIIMSKIIEYPVLRFRDKYFPSRSKSLVPAEKTDISPVPATSPN